MTDATKPAIGLSVGATTLAAVTSDRSVTRKPVLTLPGLTISDFVDRVGDPVGIVASDGSVHPAADLLADALRGLAYEATAGRPLPTAAAVSYPAHWAPVAVDALRRAIRRLPEWTAGDLLMVPDAAAAATALQVDPGLPTRGVIALCDVGGSGTTLTLLDAAAGYRPIGAPLRYLDFSGDLIDQAVLAHVVGELSAGGTVDITGTSAIGSLSRLRSACRAAKERLSTASVSAVPADLPGFTGDVRLTRAELDEVMRRPLTDLLAAVVDVLSRTGVRSAELAAVATIGGGAATPVITTMLSEHLRVPVITAPRPGLIPAIGAALRAARGPADENPTALAAAPVVPAPAADPAPFTGAALAWSQAPDLPEFVAPQPEPAVPVRPQIDFEPEPVEPVDTPAPWYRRPLPVVAAALVVIAMAGAGAAVALRASGAAAPAEPTPSVTTTPEALPTVTAVAPPPASPTPVQLQAPIEPAPAPVTQTQVVQAPPPVTETSTTTVVTTEVSTPPPVTETATVTAPPPSQTPPAPPAVIPTIPPIPTIPGLPPFLQPRLSG